MQLTQALHKALRECPQRPATVCAGRRQSYQRLVHRVARLGAALRSLGVRPGDRVGMLGLNSDRYIEYLYGTLWSGAAINPINARWSVAEIAYSLDDCDTRVLLVDDSFAQLIGPLRQQSRSLTTVVYAGDGSLPPGALSYEELLAHSEPASDAGAGDRDLAAVLYTGGTTGHPKGVMLSHDNLALNVFATLAASPRLPGAVGLHVAPLFHVAGVSLILQLTARHGCQVVLPGFEPGAALRAIEAEKVQETFMVPTMIRLLLEHEEFPQRDLRTLRTLLYGASPIDPTLQQQLLTLLPQLECCQLYGQTEAAPCVTALTPEHHRKGGDSRKRASAGRPLGIAEVRVVDPAGTELPNGQVGEICVRGPTVMLGYWNKPELTAEAVRDGWLHSGDAGYQDEDGFIYVVDRIKDMIISGGENVYSCEVEKALLSHPAVAMCAVIGVPDERWGERVHAVIVRQPDSTVLDSEIIAHCKSLIAGYKCPRTVEFRNALPLSAAGKLLKHVLREPYWRGRGRRIA